MDAHPRKSILARVFFGLANAVMVALVAIALAKAVVGAAHFHLSGQAERSAAEVTDAE